MAEFQKAVSAHAEAPSENPKASTEENRSSDDVIDADFKATSVD